MQHMSIYGIFVVHGAIDILMSYGVPLPKNWDYLSGIAAFAWYGARVLIRAVTIPFHAPLLSLDSYFRY